MDRRDAIRRRARADIRTRKNGKKLDPFMPYEGLARMDDTEKHALFAFLQTLPPVKFGNR